tara:strand:+ start:91 stop:1287 length:1197 start_codon:yes stop_codon:yes gene_type:complete
MPSRKTILFVEINNYNYIFIAGEYDENLEFKIINKLIVNNSCIEKNRFINFDLAQEIVKKNVQIIEEKTNSVFKEVIIILDNLNYTSVNISGYKKLNGSQVLKENISYILNSLKLAISENLEEKTILQIFNTKSVLDGVNTHNLPIGLFGNFYNHELSFFLIENNDLKNLNKIFNKNNLKIKKIFIRKFIEGVEMMNKKKDIDTFFKLDFYKENSILSFFYKSSFKLVERFNFGTNMILQDIAKVCSLEHKVVNEFLSDKILNFSNKVEDAVLDKKYFNQGLYRKIKIRLIKDIAKARIDEIIKIIYTKNLNIKSLKNKDNAIYLTIHDKEILQNFFTDFQINFKDYEDKINFIEHIEIDNIVKRASHLSTYGWKNEAIPIAQTKSSLITRIFKSLFN